jgi:hypothetical protein
LKPPHDGIFLPIFLPGEVGSRFSMKRHCQESDLIIPIRHYCLKTSAGKKVMTKIKIFTAKNVQRYGFTDGEIDELNAEWERKASELGLEEHHPEYWQEAKQHMREKLEGRVAASGEESGNKQLDGEPIELPSLDVNLDDFDIAGENEITAVDLSDEETEVEFLSDELTELESIPVDDLELEVIPEGQTVSLEEMAEEEKTAE